MFTNILTNILANILTNILVSTTVPVAIIDEETDVEKEKNNLVAFRDVVRVKVEAIDHKIEKVNDDVFEWLNETEILIQEVENLMAQAKTQHVQQNEFRKLKMEAMDQTVKYFDLRRPYSTPIPSLEHFSCENIVCFNSREKASDQLLVALKDDNCSVIGLYGIIHGGEEYSPSSLDLLDVAREVSFECEGLPGTIKDVGSSLRSKPIEEWKTTLDSLKHSMAKWQIFLSFRGEDTRYSFTVEPSDIRHLRKCYGKDTAQHDNNFGISLERVQKWRSALFEVSNLSGKIYTTGYEYEFIQKIVEDVNRIKSRLQIRST
ncbi:hypothetical protein P8452_26889 [Trifolium repens]|nr:hypothetical protein P8452_26889 [Trifolium repens]